MTNTANLAQESINNLLDGVQALQKWQAGQFEHSVLKGIRQFDEFIEQGLPFEDYLTPFLEGLYQTQLIQGSKEEISQALPSNINDIHGRVGYLFWLGVSSQTRDTITRFIETFDAHLKVHQAE